VQKDQRGGFTGPGTMPHIFETAATNIDERHRT
jgi:hypothetical protein